MFSIRRTALKALQTRTYASASSSAQGAPLQLFGVDGTYATALYTAAQKSSSLEAVDKALSTLTGILSKDAKVATLIANPTLSPEDKKAIVEVLSKQAGGEKSISNLLGLMAENNRLGMLPAVGDAFSSLMRAQKGEVDVTVTSAQALDNKVMKQLENSISKSSFAGAGKKLKISNKVNPEILGGLVVEIGDRTIDLSVQNKITKLNKMLTDSI